VPLPIERERFLPCSVAELGFEERCKMRRSITELELVVAPLEKLDKIFNTSLVVSF
jgi:hypothetical protein